MNDEVIDSLRHAGPFIYNLDVGNLGNFVLSFAEMQLFDRLGLDYKIIRTSNAANLTSRKFTLVQGGGGIWISNYRSAYKVIIDTLFKSRNLERCIVLPSSFHECDDAVECFDDRFTVFCRDRKSYEYCVSKNKKAKFLVHDDMAFFSDFSVFDISKLPESPEYPQIGNACGKVRKFLNGISDFKTGNFIRTDSERTSINSKFKNSFDISNVLGFPPSCEITKKLVYDGTQIMAYALNRFDEINTNRLHVSITAALLGKKVNLYDNSYGKLFNVYDQTLHRFHNVTKRT